jgi:hypothetical protein
MFGIRGMLGHQINNTATKGSVLLPSFSSPALICCPLDPWPARAQCSRSISRHHPFLIHMHVRNESMPPGMTGQHTLAAYANARKHSQRVIFPVFVYSSIMTQQLHIGFFFLPVSHRPRQRRSRPLLFCAILPTTGPSPAEPGSATHTTPYGKARIQDVLM